MAKIDVFQDYLWVSLVDELLLEIYICAIIFHNAVLTNITVLIPMKWILIIFPIVIGGCLSNPSTQPSLLLLGTVHSATEQVNADSIYEVLLKFKPDIILVELDSSFFYDDFTFNTLFNGNEMIATTRYKMNYPNTQIRPIEFEGREKYRDIIGIYPELAQEFGEAIQQLIANHQISFDDRASINKLVYYDSLVNVLKLSSLQIINSPSSDTIVDSLNYYKYVKLKDISTRYDVFAINNFIDSKGDTTSLRENFALFADFEVNKRNESLARNSIHMIEAFPNKRIIILVGFAHRPYILKKLTEKGISFQKML